MNEVMCFLTICIMSLEFSVGLHIVKGIQDTSLSSNPWESDKDFLTRYNQEGPMNWAFDDSGEQIDFDDTHLNSSEMSWGSDAFRILDGDSHDISLLLPHRSHTIEYAAESWKRVPTCPKVYVYNLSAPFQDLNVDELTRTSVFGRQIQEAIFETNQFGLAAIFLYRFLSGECHETDPSKADLFFIPLLAAKKGMGEWRDRCEQIAGKEEQLQQLLPYLNEATASKHFMLVSKGFYVGASCPGWSNPTGLFKKIARISYQVAIDQNKKEEIWEQHENDQKRFAKHFPPEGKYPRHFAVPYPSSIHLTKDMDVQKWISRLDAQPRAILASFIGSSNHGDPVRKHIATLCGKGIQCTSFHSVTEALETKAKSVFCLEPIGDSIGRKSLSDSYAMGCIPVFFGNAQQLQYPLFWQDWKDPFVVVDRLAFMNGEFDLISKLKSLEKSGQTKIMRKTLLTKSMRFLYNIENVPGATDDGFLLILRHLSTEAMLEDK